MRASIFLYFVIVISFLLVDIYPVKTYELDSYEVLDGDTLKWKNEKIRLNFIDAPEMSQKDIGKKAQQHLRQLLQACSFPVKLQIQKRDIYGRFLGILLCGERSLNFEMIQDGYAVIYTYTTFLSVAEKKSFIEAQMRAVKEKRGIFRFPFKLPRFYRKLHKVRKNLV